MEHSKELLSVPLSALVASPLNVRRYTGGQVEELAPMGFGHADLVIAVPAAWTDVETLDDLDAVAAAFRRAHGHRLLSQRRVQRVLRSRRGPSVWR